MTTYHSLPATIEAIQWTGGNEDDIRAFIGHTGPVGMPGTVPTMLGGFDTVPLTIGGKARLWVDANHAWLPIDIGEWIAKDSKGFYPIKPDIFENRWSAQAPIEPTEEHTEPGFFVAWVRENREALVSGILAEWHKLGIMSKGHATDEDSAESALTAILDAWVSDVDDRDNADDVIDAEVLDPWQDAQDAIERFFEAESIIPEGWVLAVEDTSTFRHPKEALQAFGSKDITAAHAYGILAFAGDNVHKGLLR